MKKILNLMLIVFVNYLFAINNNKVDCLILEDENSIICKYIQTRVSFDKTVVFDWIEPDGKITRTKELIIPAGHGSVYDYRYIKGRTKGTWTFRVTDANKQYKTTFDIK